MTILLTAQLRSFFKWVDEWTEKKRKKQKHTNKENTEAVSEAYIININMIKENT